MRPSNVASFRLAESRYAAWLADNEGLGIGLCWSVSRSAADVSVLNLLSSDCVSEGDVDLGGLDESSFDDGSSREHVGWLIDTGSHVAVLELNGFGGSLRPGLQAWSAQARSLSGMFWNVELDNQVAVARDGRLATTDVGSDSIDEVDELLNGYLRLVTPETDIRAFGLTVVETETGLRLDDELLSRRWPLVRFAAREDAPSGAGTTIDRLDAALYAALVAASDGEFREAKMLSCRLVAEATGLASDPIVQKAIEWNRTGQELGHDSRLSRQLLSLYYDMSQQVDPNWHRTANYDDLAWRRMHAAGVIERMTRVLQRYDSEYDDGDEVDVVDAEGMQDVWQHVGWAAGQSWPTLRQQLMNIVT